MDPSNPLKQKQTYQTVKQMDPSNQLKQKQTYQTVNLLEHFLEFFK
jgi:hypothetical protein